MSDSDDPRETLKICPACGGYDKPHPLCRACKGRGLVSLKEINDYAARQRSKATSSTTKELPQQIRDAITSLRKRGTAQVAPMIIVGQVLLERFEREPPNHELYLRLTDWLAAVVPIITRTR